MNRMSRLGLLLLLMILPVAICAQVSELERPGVSGRLLKSLNDDDFPLLQSDGTLAVWVYFTDKGDWEELDLDTALDKAKQRLTKRSVLRRAKIKKKRDDELVDLMDVAVLQAYVDQVVALGARKRQESRWLNAVSFDMERDLIETVAALPFVSRVTLVHKFRRTPISVTQGDLEESRNVLTLLRARKSMTSPLDYGGSLPALEQINVPKVHAEGVTGKGVLVGMMDTGFRLTHEALSHINVVDQWDFVDNDPIVDNEPGDPSTAHWHGTMTLSTIAGFSPGDQMGPAYDIDVILARTEDVSQEIPIEEDNWVAGIEWLESLGVDIVSSSLGYYDWYTFEDLDGNTAVCTIAADIAVGRGVVVVNSAGNERNGFDHIITPADGDSVITAGAVTVTDALASFSSPGPTYDGRIKPDIAALGAAVKVADPDVDDDYKSVAGTSFSCPLSAGVAALILSRVPMMTPMQVREALRMTADRSDSPDNDFGWGIIDAYAAIHYFGPMITHDPLPDSESSLDPYTVVCDITDRTELDPSSLLLNYRLDGGPWHVAALAPTGGDSYTADIPAQPSGTLVEYYLEAGDDLDITMRAPHGAPFGLYAFTVGPDSRPPEIVHVPLLDTPLQIWPPQVGAYVTDNVGVAQVSVAYAVNGTPQAGFNLSPAGDDLFKAAFPLPAGALSVGDMISYTITATDATAASNASDTGTRTFQVIDALGRVLLVDDATSKLSEPEKFNLEKQALEIPASVKAPVTQDIERWLVGFGYIVTTQSAAALAAEDLADQDIVMLSSGNNADPVSGTARQIIVDWTDAGGRLLVEGGETAYDALIAPVYNDFASSCLRASAWGGDTGGDLIMSADPLDHPLTSYPEFLPRTIPLDLQAYPDQDMAYPAPGARVLYGTAASYQYGGVLVYDDNPAPAAGQIVNFCFNLGAVSDTTTAKSLLCNAMFWLAADEGEPTCAIDGLVSLGAPGDAPTPVQDALIDLGDGQTAISGPDGSFSLDALYPGDYVLEYSRADMSVERMPITLIEGQTLDLALPLYSVTEVNYASTQPVAVPDNDPGGIVSEIVVGGIGRLSRLDVDLYLSHSWIGDLVVTLTSPAGTTVRLHNRGGSSSDDIVGNYPQTLIPSGPGSLEDFHDQNVSGVWTLAVHDLQIGDGGTLLTWGLNLSIAPSSYSEMPELQSRRVSLYPNAPNPFNPRTVIRFATDRASSPALDIFDMRGRRVRTLLSGKVLPADEHRVVWDGTDDRGRRLPSGIYLYRLSVDGQVRQRKMLMAR